MHWGDWIIISEYLELHEIANVSATCKALRRLFTNSDGEYVSWIPAAWLLCAPTKFPL